jgi:hypothetical protein
MDGWMDGWMNVFCFCKNERKLLKTKDACVERVPCVSTVLSSL